MKVQLRLTEELFLKLQEIAEGVLETAAVLLGNMSTPDSCKAIFTAREIHPLGEEHYKRRTAEGMTISSPGYTSSLSRAEAISAVAVWVHSHPGYESQPLPSSHDLKVDRDIADVFRIRTNQSLYGALIVSPRKDGIALGGHFQDDAGQHFTISDLLVVGERIRLVRAVDCNDQRNANSEIYDRSVRAFGTEIQNLISKLDIGIVGAGGTGSAVAEILARLGVKHFRIFDYDELSKSNISRVYGSSVGDEGSNKALLARKNIQRIAPDAEVLTFESSINQQSVAVHLAGCDIVFGCTDDNAGRLVLSRLPSYLLNCLIDCGVLIEADEVANIRGINGRITTVVPGAACLLCRKRINVAQAGAELMDPKERKRLAGEGYVPAITTREPAVVTFTTAVAAQAVNELLERLIGFGPEVRPSETLLRFHEREISGNQMTPRPGHYCSREGGKIGCGIGTPFLDLAWVS